MNGKLVALKNIIWAFSIMVCLVALAAGLIFASAVRYDGSGQLPSAADGGQEEEAVSAALPAGNGTLMTLAETEDRGQTYIDSLTFLCDSALIGLRDYGLLTGGTATTQVWGSAAGNIAAADLATCTIKFPGDGSELTPADAAAVSQPPILVVSLGTDGLASVTEEDFIANYTTLINSIRLASPSTRILACSLTSVTTAYTGNDGLTASLVASANEWITQICADTGAYFVDAASAVCDSSSGLFEEYASSNGKTLNSAGLNEILLYLRTHAL